MDKSLTLTAAMTQRQEKGLVPRHRGDQPRQRGGGILRRESVYGIQSGNRVAGERMKRQQVAPRPALAADATVEAANGIMATLRKTFRKSEDGGE